MIYKDINDVVKDILNDNIIRLVAAGIIFVSIVLAIFISFLAGAIILCNYVVGVIICFSVLRYQKSASVYLQRLASFYKGHISPRKQASQTCKVCSDAFCNRHEPALLKHPWKKLHVNTKLNSSIEHFYNRILDTFVLIWYENLTNDESFGNELRHILRFASASGVNKVLELETGHVITNKLIPCAIKHIDDYLCMQQMAEIKNVALNDIAVEYLGNRLHIAATSRNNEISYLKHLTECLLPKLLPADYLKCHNFSVFIRELFSCWVLLPLMDVLADPNIINSLIILLATYKYNTQEYQNQPEKNVEFLQNFINKETNDSLLGLNLKTVLKTPSLLYEFMKFLKREGYLHLLQFCLDVEEFNNKLLKPELTKQQLETLHIEASKLYKSYFSKKSSDFIGCPVDISDKFKELLTEGIYNVGKLRTSEPLFEAFDYTFGVLEKDWLPLFYHSNEFYSIICGAKVTANYTKATGAKSPMLTSGSPMKIRSKKLYDSQGTVAKISSGLGRIKGALKTTQPIEGAIYPNEMHVTEAESVPFMDEITPPGNTKIIRDLSLWKITVPSYSIHQISQSKMAYYFNVNVERIDDDLKNDSKRWMVQRKDQDFYTLKAKLVEFHGENEFSDSILPSRRIPASPESRKNTYQEFLKKLISKPSLKGSDLLHMFLTLEQEEFTVMATSAVPIGDLGNIYQSVAHKLRKEKGQHLDSFMHTFLASTGKIKQNKFEWGEQVEEKDTSRKDSSKTVPKTLRNNVFRNNYDVQYRKTQDNASSSFNPNGITESLFYLLKHIFNVHKPILKLYAAICSVSQQAVESFTRFYIERKLKSALCEENLAYLIGLLEGVIFEKHKTPSKEELELRKEKAFKELLNLLPNYVSTVLGQEFKSGLCKLLEILQNPCYNKQLVYNLLDIIIVEMYPEFDSVEETA